MAMTAEAKRHLSSTIRSLRSRLPADLRASAEGAYRLSVRGHEAGLDEAARVRRSRLEAWVAEQARAAAKSGRTRAAEDFFREAEKQAAYTLLNRLVILRLMEAWGLRVPAVVSAGWESPGYQQFRELGRALVRNDETEGYAFLLKLVFEDLALELPGLYGPVGVVDLIPVPAATLRQVVEALAEPALESCWTDDMTLGWVYQYWNDPDREALDDKLNSGGKVEPHEIASKTQMFTERYMVDWLLQNSLGPMWLAMCRKHGWAPEVEADGTLERLERRRVAWRQKRESGEVSLTELMPLHGEAESRWAYFVPQPIPRDAVEKAADSVRDLRILDPAVGSGHFLVVAFDLLVALYREEARHRGESGAGEWTDRAIVERILEHNLHGIDLDPRAVQIAAAALWLKARRVCRDAHPSHLNLVASNLRLSCLADDDPALVELRREVEEETGIPGGLTDTLVHALQGADHLGSLLKVDAAVDEALRKHEGVLARSSAPEQVALWDSDSLARETVAVDVTEARASILGRLERFLSHHSGGDDLGLRLRGEQLAAGVRFVRMVREGTYDLIVGNPPYQGTSKIADAAYVRRHYPRGKSDLYAAFLERGLSLVRDGGYSSLLTLRNWMFIAQYADLRVWLLGTYDLRGLGDFDRGAFAEIPDEVVAVVVSVFRKGPPVAELSVAVQPTPPDNRSRDNLRTQRKRAAVIAQTGRYEFDPQALKAVPDWPLVYWWNSAFLAQYSSKPTLGEAAEMRFGLNSGNNNRFTRRPWENLGADVMSVRVSEPLPLLLPRWHRYLKGAAGVVWIDPVDSTINWINSGLEVKVLAEALYGSYSRQIRSERFYYRGGVAFSMIGASFGARLHRWRCVLDSMGSSLFPSDEAQVLCLMNSQTAKRIIGDLNPTAHFQLGDVKRLPVIDVPNADAILAEVDDGFSKHEAHREQSIEFLHPGPSSWRYAQEWAQSAVDRLQGAPLPLYEPEYDPEPPTDHLSFALGVALGRFGPDGAGTLDPSKDDLGHAFPAGVLFLDGSLPAGDDCDSLGQPAAAPLHAAWAEHGRSIGGTRREHLRDWLRLDFFGVHRGMYENRPIHWPLSSFNRTFVAWINIHRWTEQTLRILLADHLHPALSRLEGELSDLRAALDGASARTAEKRYERVFRVREELAAFIAAVEQCADRGAPTDPKCPPREVDARYVPDLDDGVMINSAALWPLLEPQWKDPKKWWKELATAKDRKDYDWSRLAMRYWPTRVNEKCRTDPSLGVAHGCFWKYHPARAWAWELRLQDEIAPGFRIEEAPYRGDGGDEEHREAWLRDHPEAALAAVEKEALRRTGRGKSRAPVPEMVLLERGLWSREPELCWKLELRVSEKQGAEFRLLAPDEAGARAAYEAANPDKVRERAEILANLTPDAELLLEDEDELPEDDFEAAEDEAA